MATQKKAGADLAALEEIGHQTDALQERLKGARKLSIDRLQPNPDQPRRTIGKDGIENLRKSIESTGIIEPLIVRPHGDGFQIICGERRYLAAKALGLMEVPVIVREADDITALRVAYEENVQREDLPLLDEAMFLNGLIEKGHVKSQKELAETMGVTPTRVTQKLKVLKLPEPIRDGFVKHSFLGELHARSLERIENEKLQNRLFEAIIDRELSGRKAELLVESALAALGKAGKLPKRRRVRSVTFNDAKLSRSGKNYILRVPVQSADDLAAFFSALAKALKEKEISLPRQSESSASAS